MLFAELAKTFDRIESEPSRLSMTAILSDFLKTVEADEISDVIFLSQGKLRPDFYPQVFGMSDKLVIKAITSTVGMPESEVTEIVIKEIGRASCRERV